MKVKTISLPMLLTSLIFLTVLLVGSALAQSPTIRLADPKTGDAIEFDAESFDNGTGSCSLIHNDSRTAAKFQVDENRGIYPWITITLNTGQSHISWAGRDFFGEIKIKLILGEKGLVLAGGSPEEKVFAWPAGPKEALPERAKAAICLSNANQIANACWDYAEKTNDHFPHTITELVPVYIPEDKKSIFISPFATDKTKPSYTLLLPDADAEEAPKTDPKAILIRCDYASKFGRSIVHVEGLAETTKGE